MSDVIFAHDSKNKVAVYYCINFSYLRLSTAAHLRVLSATRRMNWNIVAAREAGSGRGRMCLKCARAYNIL